MSYWNNCLLLYGNHLLYSNPCTSCVVTTCTLFSELTFALITEPSNPSALFELTLFELSSHIRSLHGKHSKHNSLHRYAVDNSAKNYMQFVHAYAF